MLSWGFGTLGLARITAMIRPGTTASSAVAQRLGFTPLREDTVLGRPCIVHALDRDDVAGPGALTTAPQQHCPVQPASAPERHDPSDGA